MARAPSLPLEKPEEILKNWQQSDLLPPVSWLAFGPIERRDGSPGLMLAIDEVARQCATRA
jgi:hypothetical protein